MKTLEKIKDEVAIDNDYRNWRVLPPTARERLLPEVCKRYAMEFKVDKDVPPIWYTQNEIYDDLIRNKYSEEIAKELSQKWADDLQGAFNKGYEKGNANKLSYARAALESINIEAITERIDKVSFIPFDFEKNVKEILKSSITDIELP